MLLAVGLALLASGEKANAGFALLIGAIMAGSGEIVNTIQVSTDRIVDELKRARPSVEAGGGDSVLGDRRRRRGERADPSGRGAPLREAVLRGGGDLRIGGRPIPGLAPRDERASPDREPQNRPLIARPLAPGVASGATVSPRARL
jgi:hypothetical protein